MMNDPAEAIVAVLRDYLAAREAHFVAIAAGLRSRIELLERAALRDAAERRQALQFIDGIG